MNKEKWIYIHTHTHTHTDWNIIQPLKEGNVAICDSMDESWRHYAQWNKSDRERQILCCHLYVESKNIELTETGNRMMGEMGEGGHRYKLPVTKWVSFRNLMYSLVTTVNNTFGASLVAQLVKNLPAMWETQVRSLGREDSLEKGMATHSSILACRIPWAEVFDRLQSTGLQRVIHD